VCIKDFFLFTECDFDAATAMMLLKSASEQNSCKRPPSFFHPLLLFIHVLHLVYFNQDMHIFNCSYNHSNHECVCNVYWLLCYWFQMRIIQSKISVRTIHLCYKLLNNPETNAANATFFIIILKCFLSTKSAHLNLGFQTQKIGVAENSALPSK